ncbi:MAG: acyl-CoA carboxylase subunit epsilon [Burkholderiaceae bacterium]|nr:acyl-CoA carboxylase subunit epsilon [Microbacteriaceae bacterium]
MSEADVAQPGLTVLGGNPTATELAAVLAVIAAVAEELGDDASVSTAVAQSAWQRSQRPIRGPLRPGAGAWRGFSG